MSVLTVLLVDDVDLFLAFEQRLFEPTGCRVLTASSGAQALALARTNLVLTLTNPIQSGSGGLDVDADGNIYAADFGATLNGGAPGNTVYKITPNGQVSVFATGLVGSPIVNGA